MNTIDPLALPLKPLMMPPPVHWWPLAPGWWGIIGIVLLIMIASVAWFIYRKGHMKRWAKKQLRMAYQDYLGHKQKSVFIQQMSYLLRQICLAKKPEAASLTGDEWLVVLEQMSPVPVVRTELGTWLIKAPYASEMACETAPIESLYQLCLKWVNQL